MDEFDNVNRDNKTPNEINDRPSEFFVDRDNFLGSEFNTQVNKKKIKKAIAIVSTVVSISLIAGGGISIGSQSFQHANATIAYTSLNIESRQISYEIEVESTVDLSLTLSNDFINRVNTLKPGKNIGTFENIKPNTKYNLYVNAHDLFGTKLENKEIKTPEVSSDDIFYFDTPAIGLDGKYNFKIYYDEQKYNKDELDCIFIPTYGESFNIKVGDPEENIKIDLKNHNIYSSDGAIKIINHLNNEDILLEKKINFTNKETLFLNSTLIEKDTTYKLDIDFIDKNNVRKEFYIEIASKNRFESKYYSKKRIENEGVILNKSEYNGDYLDVSIYVIANASTYKKFLIFDKEYNLNGGE